MGLVTTYDDDDDRDDDDDEFPCLAKNIFAGFPVIFLLFDIILLLFL